MKKKVFLFISILTIMFMVPKPVSADIGPKPSIKIDIAGLKSETYYVVLLTKHGGGGPYADVDEINIIVEEKAKKDDLSEDDLLFIKLASYEDEDDFNFIG